MSQDHEFTKDGAKNLISCLPPITRKILVFSGKESYKTSGAEVLIRQFSKYGDFEITRYCDFKVNPRFTDLEGAIGKIRAINPDVIIAIGGGSVIDMAKLSRFFECHNGETFSGKYDKTKDSIPLIAIPTTAGTGSEATHFAVLYEGTTKHSIAHQDIKPDFAILDAALTEKTDAYLTACTGFDALAQAIEAYWNKNATLESDRYALEAIGLLWDSLPLAVKSPTRDIRSKMLKGAYLAGKAINITKTTAPHAFSYPFTMHYGYPHGHAVALTFPAFAAINLAPGAIEEGKRTRLLSILSLEQPIEKGISDYINDIGLDFRGESIDTSKILAGINLSRLANNPVKIDQNTAIEIITKVYS